MSEAARTGVLCATRLDPPPADPRVAHPAGGTAVGAQEFGSNVARPAVLEKNVWVC